jgi:diguanylate cyclase (GGDEF)-like protein/PAS domain S-box-containing protein
VATGQPGIDDRWFAGALQHISDMVLVIAADTTILWANEASHHEIGFPVEESIGRSIADFLHPEDLPRAAEVMTLVDAGRFEQEPVTPALYRVRTKAGGWRVLEINGSSVAGEDGEMLITARFAGDLVFGDELLEAVTGGEPLARQIELVMELGRWRYPREGYAVIAHDRYLDAGIQHDQQLQQVAVGLLPRLGGIGVGDLATPWRRAMATGEDVAVHDLTAGSFDPSILDPDLAFEAAAAGFAGCLAAPVTDPGHELGACLVVWSTHHGPSLAGHQYAVANMRRALGLVLQQRAQLHQLERAAHHDGLTGLATRARFLELLAAADAAGEGAGQHGIIYLDLDRFKAVNDRLGHAAGDRLLAECAARIGSLVPAGALAGRLGGDEFAILCPPNWEATDLQMLADAIAGRIEEPIMLGDDVASVGASVGVVFGEPGRSALEVLDLADQRLLEAKAWYRRHGTTARTDRP